MASAWSQLDQLLTCAICLDRYRNPKLLPCQHTFCMEPCLDGLIDYARRQIKCPECRAEHRIPYKGIQEFPTNVTLMRFLELHRDITGEEPEPPPSMMERCNVCSEKSNLERCAHCDKKICPDCKEAHVDILRREINRINNQVRRGLHRLSEALTQTKKNAEKLQINCDQVKEEIEDIVRRYSKDLRHTEEKLKHDLEMYTETELKTINKLKEDLEAEVSNMTSNCDLVDKYIKDDNEWSDAELLEYKEVFLKTLDFLRTFDADNSDFAKRIKFQPRADPDVLHRNIADFGELKINAPPTTAIPTQQTLIPPPSNALMRSQSDHRLAAQFARRSDRSSYIDRYGGHTSDNEREGGRPTSPIFSRGGRRDTDSSGYRRYTDRSRDYDYQDRSSSRYLREENSSSSILGSRWRDNEDYGNRSRYNRECDDYESEVQHSGSRTVRFADEAPQRERMFDTNSAPKGPLSGVIRLIDAPKVMERLHQNEVRQKQNQNDKEVQNSESKTPVQSESKSVTTPLNPTRKAPTRQQSEDDIDRQKKANQQASTSNTPSTPQNATTNSEPVLRSSLRKGTVETSKNTTVPECKDITKQSTESPSTERSETTPIRNRKHHIPENSEESETTPAINFTTQSRYSHQPLGKNISLESGTATTKTVLDKKASLPAQTIAQRTSTRNDEESENDDEDEEEEEEDEEVAEETSRPVQSSFFTRQRRLPDPEPRLLMTQDDDDDEEEEESEESEDEEEEEEDEESTVQNTAIKTTQPSGEIEKTDENRQADSETEETSESSDSSTSSTESESEDSDHVNENNTNESDTNQESIKRKSSSDSEKADDFTTILSSNDKDPSRYGNEPDIILQANRRTSHNEDDENIADLVKNIDSPSSTVRRRFSTGSDANSCDINRRKSRRRSDEMDTTDSSSSTSSTNYQSLSCNTASTLSNGVSGVVEEPVSLENNTSTANTATSNYHYTESRTVSTPRRRPVLARSKSSHEIGLGYDVTENLNDDDEDDQDSNSTTSIRNRSERMSEGNNIFPRTRSNYTTNNQEQTNSLSLSSNSNNSWANYLKNKYGSNAASKVVPRSRSSHNLYRKSDSDSSDDEISSGRDILSSPSYGFSNPRSTYMQKRRMMFKIGARGTEPGNFTWPRGIAVGPENSVVVADSSNHRVQVFDAMGKFSHEFGTYGSGPGEFDCLAGVAVNRIGQYIVSDRYNHRIQLFDPSGRFLRAFGCEGRTDGRFNYPWGLTTDSLGFIYVCDKENHRIQVFQSDGTFVGKFGSLGSRPGQLEHPHYIAVSNTNRVVVSDTNNHRIQIFDVNGRTLSTFGSEGSGESQFKFPRGVAVDDQGFIIVGDSGNNKIKIFHPDGTYLRGFGSWGAGEGEFKGLEGIAVTSAGNIVVCDRENHRIQVF